MVALRAIVGAALLLLLAVQHWAAAQDDATILCSNLGVNVKTFGFDSPVNGPLYFLGADKKYVIFRSTSSKLYHSKNGGADWEAMPALPGSPGNAMFSSIVISSDRKKVMLVGVAAARNKIWTSSIDEHGEPSYWALSEQTVHMTDLAPHPTHPEWIAALAESPDCFDTSKLANCSQDLWLSIDFGASWKPLWSYVSEFSWAGAGTEGNHANQLFVVDWTRKEGNYRQKFADYKRVLRTFTFFVSPPEQIASDVTDFLAIDDDLIIVKRAMGGGLEMYTSINDGDTWHRARFPHHELENRYSFLDTTEGSIFVNVEHKEWIWGNVYSSDSYGQDFSLSLERNPRQINGQCDFMRVQGIDGVYVANQYVEGAARRGDSIVTKISFNKGGTWHRIPAPAEETWRCPPNTECFLNLHGITTNRLGRFFSRADALGIVIGTGNVGSTLRPGISELNTYISNDAGQTWKRFANGSYDYEIANHGGLVLLAPNVLATNEVRFTSDQGQTQWSTCRFLEPLTAKMEISDIVVEPTGGAPQFILHGRQAGTNRGLIVHLDFSRRGTRTCKGLQNPGAPDSDYEYWTPKFLGSECLMGERVSFLRRKPQVDCLNPDNHPVVWHRETCKCTRADYECDQAYYEDLAGQCILWDEDFDPKKQPDYCDGEWFETRGYRLIPGDKCDPINGLDLRPIRHQCPGYPKAPGSNIVNPPAGANGFAFFLVIPAVAFVLAGFALFYAMTGRNQSVRSCATICLPESILPAFKVPEHGAYSALNQGPEMGDDDLDQMAASRDAEPIPDEPAPETHSEEDSVVSLPSRNETQPEPSLLLPEESAAPAPAAAQDDFDPRK